MAVVKRPNRSTSPRASGREGSDADTGFAVDVRVTPRADRDAICGMRADGVLTVRTVAAPVDGKANDAVVRLVAESLGVRPGSVALVAGHRSRDKRLVVNGVAQSVVAVWKQNFGPKDPESNCHV